MADGELRYKREYQLVRRSTTLYSDYKWRFNALKKFNVNTWVLFILLVFSCVPGSRGRKVPLIFAQVQPIVRVLPEGSNFHST